MGHDLTAEQVAIIRAASRLERGLCQKTIAFAGSGKTFTLRAVADNSGLGRGMYAAFNKAIALEAALGFPDSVLCRTLHSFAFAAMVVRDSNINTRALMAQGVRDAGIDGWIPKQRCGFSVNVQARLVGRTVGLFCQSADDEITARHVEPLLDRFVYRMPLTEPDPVTEPEDHARHVLGMQNRVELGALMLAYARTLWGQLGRWKHTGARIDHDIYLKAFQLDGDLVRRSFKRFDYLMIDEAQDLNPVMRAIGEASGARLFPVGDPWQQIYTWRGAEDALERLPGERLYLSQSFRFGEAIAEVARRILASKPRFAPPVDLRGSAKQSRVGLYRGQRVPVLLCRGNTRLLKEATAVAKAGLRPHIIGGLREIAEELREAWLLYAGRRDELPESSHFVRFEHWRDLVEETRQLCDQQMEQLIKSVEEGLVQDLRMLEEMHVTDEAAADVVLSTAHRAKGREWSTVALADDFPGLWRLGRKYDDALDRRASVMPALEEWHVLYVAATRAVDCLLLPPRLYQWLMDAS